MCSHLISHLDVFWHCVHVLVILMCAPDLEQIYMMREGGLKQHVVCLVQDILILQKAGNETTTQPELDLG